MADTKNRSYGIFSFKDEKTLPDAVFEYPSNIASNNVPLIIDNGVYKCRAGWATLEQPQLTFKNITAKQKGKKELDVQVGNEINNVEVAKWILRTQFDRNLVTLYDVQEQIYDYIFAHLGINTEGQVNHPIVMTEALCNPGYCRQQMSELLFECYHVPSVAYGVDALFSLYNNQDITDQTHSLIVGCGYQTTTLIPVVGGRVHSAHSRRINMGGAQLDAFMQRLLQLKYPGHIAAVTLSRAEELVRDHCYMAEDYIKELEAWTDNDYYENNVTKIQLPYNAAVSGSQLTAEQLKERREQQIRRLKESNAKRRIEKLQMEEEKLMELISVQELLEDEDEEAFNRALSSLPYETAEELQVEITRLTMSIQRMKAKIKGIDLPIDEEAKKPAAVYDLIDIPDDQLTPDQISIKKRQRMLKNAREGRMKAQAIQREKQQKEMEEEKKLEQRRIKDFSGWLQLIRDKRKKLLDIRNAKKQRKADLAKRRTYASQQRMKMITQLVSGGSKKKKEDTFGQNDADWEVYKEIHPENADSDSEADEDKLEELETLLKEHDPEFQKEMDQTMGQTGEFDIAEYYKLHLAVEKIRVPELLFQPSMIGIEQAGIAETMDFVFKKFDTATQNKLAQNVFITGGNAMFGHFKERLECELLAMRPFQSTFNVSIANNPILDAWSGARKLALSPLLTTSSITKAEYEEKGSEYMKEHCASNRYFQTPASNK
ncbi:actin-related protein 5-like [Ostrea edulis]|uniref:actin-related protein 5-like n=1 Tax=Ostrea edulis TaxID=37623 RepID=UPI002095A673|nr:actin-related protein 5-like [Ostrea edulis]